MVGDESPTPDRDEPSLPRRSGHVRDEMARWGGVEKVDLRRALMLLQDGQPLAYSVWVETIRSCFACSERAAKDAVSVLRQAGYADTYTRAELGYPNDNDPARRANPSAFPRRGRIFYMLTERGDELLALAPARGANILRSARRLYTTVPTPRIRAYQQAIELHEGRDDRLRKLEGKPPLNVRTVVLADDLDDDDDAAEENLLDLDVEVLAERLRRLMEAHLSGSKPRLDPVLWSPTRPVSILLGLLLEG